MVVRTRIFCLVHGSTERRGARPRCSTRRSSARGSLFARSSRRTCIADIVHDDRRETCAFIHIKRNLFSRLYQSSRFARVASPSAGSADGFARTRENFALYLPALVPLPDTDRSRARRETRFAEMGTCFAH